MACLLSAASAFWLAAFLCRFRAAPLRARPRYLQAGTAQRVTQAFERLFSAEEYRYVASVPGSPAGLAGLLRRNRRRVLGAYLQQIRQEHREAVSDLRGLAAQLDRPDLAAEAVRRSVRFNLVYWSLRVQLASGIPVNKTTLAWVGMFRPTILAPATVGAGASTVRTRMTA